MCAFLTIHTIHSTPRIRCAKEENEMCAGAAGMERKNPTTRGRRWLLSNQKLTSSCNVIYNKVDHDDIVLPSSASTETDIEIHFSNKLLFAINRWRVYQLFYVILIFFLFIVYNSFATFWKMLHNDFSSVQHFFIVLFCFIWLMVMRTLFCSRLQVALRI